MATVLAFAGLATLGYLMGESELDVEETRYLEGTHNTNIVLPKDKATTSDIYHNRRSDSVFNDELTRSTHNQQKAMDNQFLYRNRPQTKWQRRVYSKSDKKLQLEKDLQARYPHSTTKPSSTITQFKRDEHIKGYNLQGVYDDQINTTFNERRNNIPNPKFVPIEADNSKKDTTQPVIFGTQIKKDVKYHATHNNMEPFISSKQTQTLDPEAFNQFLESYTGSEVLYPHKKETKRFFPTLQDPYIFGLPSTFNREKDRFVTSLERNNTLPFHQIRVAPGLNRNANDVTSNIGFHDPYRPLGRGQFKPIEDLQVNSKNTYKGRVIGEHYYVPFGTEQSAPTMQHKPYKTLSFSYFPEQSRDEEHASKTYFEPKKTEVVEYNKKEYVKSRLEKDLDAVQWTPAQSGRTPIQKRELTRPNKKAKIDAFPYPLRPNQPKVPVRTQEKSTKIQSRMIEAFTDVKKPAWVEKERAEKRRKEKQNYFPITGQPQGNASLSQMNKQQQRNFQQSQYNPYNRKKDSNVPVFNQNSNHVLAHNSQNPQTISLKHKIRPNSIGLDHKITRNLHNNRGKEREDFANLEFIEPLDETHLIDYVNTSQFPHRDMLPELSDVQHAEVLDKDSIVLKEVERTETGASLGSYPTGPKGAIETQRQPYDAAKFTIRESTEENIYPYINVQDEDKRHQTYLFDIAKHTIREQTEENKFKHINAQDQDRRATTYFFDVAKETILEQTEEAIHSHINIFPSTEAPRNTTYFFDVAKETILEQTEEAIHKRINPTGVGKFALQDIVQYLNASINGLREAAIAFDRPPTTEGAKTPYTKEHIGEFQIFTKQQLDNYEFSKGYDVTAPYNHNKDMIGDMTNIRQQYPKDVPQQADRYNPVLVEAFNKNPYTQPLDSYVVPYNPAFPIVRPRNETYPNLVIKTPAS